MRISRPFVAEAQCNLLTGATCRKQYSKLVGKPINLTTPQPPPEWAPRTSCVASPRSSATFNAPARALILAAAALVNYAYD
ncbi:hypothetical protein VTH06DRAFT_873 [Thermothelomyces fergusii]